MSQVLQVLRWMMQKDQLSQDMLLLGYVTDHPIRSWQAPDIFLVCCARSPPGELRRRIALRFCEVAQREYEFISLSRDTTEADLKQRREIVGNSVRFVGTLIMRNHQVVHDDTHKHKHTNTHKHKHTNTHIQHVMQPQAYVALC